MRFVETPRKYVFAKLHGERDLSLWIKNFAIINLCGVNFCKFAITLTTVHVVILPTGSENSRRDSFCPITVYFFNLNIFGNALYILLLFIFLVS